MQVLVVDDDAVSIIALKDVMGRAGFTDIIDFEDGQDAWDYLQTGPMPVLCCCDVRMPKMTGIQLLRNIRKDSRLSTLPFILVTSGSQRGVVNEAIVLGVSGYIVKPFNRNTTSEKILDVFNQAYRAIAEKPDATAIRLSISVKKLVTYYDGFIAQVNALIRSLENATTKDVTPAIKEQFTDIHKGCLTLGLWQCSKQLERLERLEYDKASAVQYLLPLISTAEYQISMVNAPAQ